MRAEVIIEVPFHDVDMMNVVWHGHYIKYFEIARCKLLDQIDYNYPQMQQSGYLWPVIECQCRYAKPLVFGQRVKVIAEIKEWLQRLKINYVIQDADTGARLTRGHTVQVAVEAASREMCFQSPPVLLKKLAQWPAFDREALG